MSLEEWITKQLASAPPFDLQEGLEGSDLETEAAILLAAAKNLAA